MEKGFYKTYFEVEKNHWWFRARRNIIFWLIKKYAENVGETTPTIHDFGCGSGYLVGELQRRGYDASGADTSQKAVEFGRQQGVKNIEVIEPGRTPQNSLYDVILALDVVEHIKDDIEAIKGLESALKPGGMAIITVPAYQWMWGVQDEVAHHFRRYTMTGLTSIVKKAGDFTIVRKTYFNTFLFPPIAIARILAKWFNLKERESDFDINNQFLNGLFYFIFNLETFFLEFFSFPFGVSMLLIVKKQTQ